MIGRLEILKASKRQFTDIRELSSRLMSDADLRREIEVLSGYFLNRSISGCNNCYTDAYFELINLSTENIMEKQNCQFKLRRGKLLRDVVNLDISLNMTQANITNDLALYHLKTNPGCVLFFEEVPEDLNEQLEAYVLPGEGSSKDPGNVKTVIESEAQQAAEKALIAEIAMLLKAGSTKTAIKAKYKDVEKVGEKNLTVRLLDDFIKRAEVPIEQ